LLLQVVWYLAAALGALATLLTATLNMGEPREQQKGSAEGEGKAKVPRADSWAVSRALSFKSGQARLASFFSKVQGGTSRGGGGSRAQAGLVIAEADLEQPLLPS
jgi:hypothetical protein